MIKIGFSGHETFVCRHFWLKKGYDFVQAKHSFSDQDAVVRLGVGKNMVTAIRFWLKGFNVLDTDTDQPTSLGKYLFNEQTGKDPYLEDTASLWLLHYAFVKNQRVFISSAFFNQFLKEKNEFTKEQLISFLKRKTEEAGLKLLSDKTYESDATVFLRTYHRANDGKTDLEEETANLLVDLNLIRPLTKSALPGQATQWFRVIRESREQLPPAIFAFSILDRYGNEVQSIAFKDLLEGFNSPGNIFCMTEKGLEDKLNELAATWPGEFTYNETAGNRVLQIKRTVEPLTVLDRYYD